jgi:hypothetical protein
MEALLGCCNPCNSEAHNSGAARIVMGPHLALPAAQAELRALLRGAGPSQGSGEGEEEEEEQEHAEAAEEGAQGGGAPGEGAAGAGGGRRGSRRRTATDFLKPSGAQSVGGVITFAGQYTHAETSLSPPKLSLSFSKECQSMWLYLPVDNHHASISATRSIAAGFPWRERDVARRVGHG